MIIVCGEIHVEDGALDRVRDALVEMERATREESGCITYAFSCDISDASVLRIFERWESMAALEAHFGTPHMAAFGAAVAQAQPKSVDVKAYDVKGEVPLPR